MNVLDASALLAYVQGEQGAADVEAVLEDGGIVGAANWSEVAQRVEVSGGRWDLTRALLASFDLVVEPVIAEDAEWAARKWRRGDGLSLADRLCLALGERLDAQIWTTDRAWGDEGRVQQIR